MSRVAQKIALGVLGAGLPVAVAPAAYSFICDEAFYAVLDSGRLMHYGLLRHTQP